MRERVTACTDALSERLLDELLQDLSPVVRAAALGTLLERDTPQSLRRFSGEWARCGADAQRRLREDPRGPILAERAHARLTRDTDAAVREIAVDVIATLSAPGYELSLFEALRDASPAVRVAAIHHLAARGGVGAREAIEALTADPEATVRGAAWQALGVSEA